MVITGYSLPGKVKVGNPRPHMFRCSHVDRTVVFETLKNSTTALLYSVRFLVNKDVFQMSTEAQYCMRVNGGLRYILNIAVNRLNGRFF